MAEPKRLSKGSAAAFAFVIAVSVTVALKAKRRAAEAPPHVKIAVIDTGASVSRAGILEGSLLPGWSYVDGTPAAPAPGAPPPSSEDEAGHGSAVAAEAVAACSGDCRIIPLKITRRGGAIRATDYAAALAKSVELGARVAVVPSGVLASATSPAERGQLEAAARAAEGAGILLVAAGGVGVTNPFQPGKVEDLLPQALPETLVVGVADTDGKPDPAGNTGPKLAFHVPMEKGERWGSSYAAGRVGGLAARLLRARPGVTPAEARKLFSASVSDGIFASRLFLRELGEDSAAK